MLIKPRGIRETPRVGEYKWEDEDLAEYCKAALTTETTTTSVRLPVGLEKSLSDTGMLLHPHKQKKDQKRLVITEAVEWLARECARDGEMAGLEFLSAYSLKYRGHQKTYPIEVHQRTWDQIDLIISRCQQAAEKFVNDNVILKQIEQMKRSDIIRIAILIYGVRRR